MKKNRKRGTILVLVIMITFLSQSVYAYDNYESNDSIQTATQIGWGQTITADLSSSSDVDYFKLYDIPATTTAYVSFTTPANSTNYDLLVWDTTTNALVVYLSDSQAAEHTETTTFNHISGHQYVAMVGTADNWVSTGNYTFNIHL